jgi:signal transduction histidine kinase
MRGAWRGAGLARDWPSLYNPAAAALQLYHPPITNGGIGGPIRLDLDSLVSLLRDDVLPALLVRQSILLRLEDGHAPVVLYAQGVHPEAIPDAGQALELAAQAGRLRPPGQAPAGNCAWVRLALRLTVERRPVGLWLLGRHDPDDYYAVSELRVLQGLADQTAVALVNLHQAQALHALYQADINQGEAERLRLARDQHDGALNELAALLNTIDGDLVPPGFVWAFQQTLAELRQMIAGLRPVMLAYGLHAALTALADELEDQTPGGPEVVIEVPTTAARYSPEIEIHTYRIAQHACTNALRYAAARTVRIGGRLEAERLVLAIEDDGVGFEARTDLAHLMAHGHFGLAGMVERAALIGARLRIESAPGKGTRVSLAWQAEAGTRS